MARIARFPVPHPISRTRASDRASACPTNRRPHDPRPANPWKVS